MERFNKDLNFGDLDIFIEHFNIRFFQFDDLKYRINLFSNLLNIDINSVQPKYQIVQHSRLTHLH